MITRNAAVEAVLRLHAPADLAAHYCLGMETFISVRPGKIVYDDDNKPIRNTFEADGFRYYTFRLQNPGDEKKPLTYPLCQYYDAIGFSGWNYVEQVAYGVGFDFDFMHGGAGLTAKELAAVLAALMKLAYVEIRRSTSGSGYHVWIWFPLDNLPKVTCRNELKALARAVLAKMRFDTGHHFDADVDHLGDILWVAARRATEENHGLTLVKAGEPLSDWPRDFLDHLEVVTRKRKRTRIKGTDTEESDAIEQANRDRPRVPLEPTHRKFIKEHEATNFYCYWDSDHHCLVGHTKAIDKIKGKIKLPGVFATVSKGTEPDKPNCFMYPLQCGGWRVYRFTPGTEEAKTWETSRNGWTTCVIGLLPTPAQVAALYHGQRTKQGWMYTPANAIKAVAAYGGKLKIPAWLKKRPRPIAIEVSKTGLLVSMERRTSDREQPAYDAGWFEGRGPIWFIYIECKTKSQQTDYEALADNLVRHVAKDDKQLGLYVMTDHGLQRQTMDQVKNHLTLEDIDGGLQKELLGWCSKHSWLRVALPFQPEYPGNRLWNKDGCQLITQPADGPGPTPYWDRAFNHWGQGLTDAVEADEWCRLHNIKDGADYLRWWLANCLRYPERRLPMLTTYSKENNTGKSMMHEAFALTMTPNGYMLSDKAIKNQNGFDAELHGKVLCAIDDVDLSGNINFYNSLKRWITNPWMNFGYKGQEVFLDRNCTHWIFTCNDRGHIPLDTGDERNVLWEITPFPPGDFIPKPVFMEQLKKEIPFLLRQLFNLNLSDVHSRLALPPLLTSEKVQAMEKCSPLTLDGLALKAAEAIKIVKKPCGPATATELNKLLGNWHGTNKEEKSCVNSLGRYMPRVKNYLAPNIEIVIGTNGKVSTYKISDKISEATHALAT
jgi:hypothetical protein